MPDVGDLPRLPRRPGTRAAHWTLWAQVDMEPLAGPSPSPPLSATEEWILETASTTERSTEVAGLAKPGRFLPALTIGEVVQNSDDVISPDERRALMASGRLADFPPAYVRGGTVIETFEIRHDRPWGPEDRLQLQLLADGILRKASLRPGVKLRYVHRDVQDRWWVYEDPLGRVDADRIPPSVALLYGDPPRLDGGGGGDLIEQFLLAAGGPYGRLAWATTVARITGWCSPLPQDPDQSLLSGFVTDVAWDALNGRSGLAAELPAHLRQQIADMMASAFHQGWRLGSHLRGIQVRDVVTRDARAAAGRRPSRDQWRERLLPLVEELGVRYPGHTTDEALGSLLERLKTEPSPHRAAIQALHLPSGGKAIAEVLRSVRAVRAGQK